MPSLRKRVSSYLRQLSFHNEPREKRNNLNENAFITKYLEGNITLREGPSINYGKIPTDLPNYELGKYEWGPNSVVGCYTGPKGGLTTVKRTEKHLSVPDDDIDFIDTPESEPILPPIPKKSPKRVTGQPIDNTTMVIKVAGNEYCVTNRPKRHSKSYSLGSISDFNCIEVEKTKIEKKLNNCDMKPNKPDECIENLNVCDKGITSEENITDKPKGEHNKLKKSNLSNPSSVNPHFSKQTSSSSRSNGIKNSSGGSTTSEIKTELSKGQNYALSKSRSDGNPFHHNKKRGKIIQVQRQQRHNGGESIENLDPNSQVNDTLLPPCWNQKSDCCYGISDSLYDRNQVTKRKNGDPIADCFGIVARNDSAILAVADGVNWGEKASIAAKAAVHGSLHYLNKTIFNDTKPFESLTNKTDDVDLSGESSATHGEIGSLVTNTREVFVCLLRAFNCAHDLILENKGMLTTLTVAVVLPLKQRTNDAKTFQESQFVCCVCNVGDTLAYVYSQKSGIRELTKGSHDVNCNRDLRDALGALGPVDGINPELSNLTLSITTLSKGDMVIIASDGLTDNFDPNVCKFTINSTKTELPKVRVEQKAPAAQKPPVKPPRKSKTRGSVSSGNQSERSNSSSEKEVKKSGSEVEFDNPLIAHFMRENSLEEPPRRRDETNTARPRSGNHQTAPFRLTKAKTSLELRSYHQSHKTHILRNPDGLPYVSPIQRYELQLLLMEDILKKGISGRDKPIVTAKRLCENMVNFTMSITSAKRRTLEDPDLYFDNRNGVLVEVSNQEKKLRRKRALDKVQPLPGKLDHVTVVAYNVGNMF